MDALPVGQLTVRLASPQPERLVVADDSGHLVTAVGQLAGLGHQPLESSGVEVVAGGDQPVPLSFGHQVPAPRTGQEPPQARDLVVQRRHRVGGRVVAPQRLDEAVGRHHGAPRSQERGEQEPLAGTWGGPINAIVVVDHDRSEHPVAHVTSSLPRILAPGHVPVSHGPVVSRQPDGSTLTAGFATVVAMHDDDLEEER